MRGPERGIVAIGAEGRCDAVMAQKRGKDTGVTADLAEEGMAAVSGRMARVVENTNRLLGTKRTLEFFTKGYRYLIQILPVLVVAPLLAHPVLVCVLDAHSPPGRMRGLGSAVFRILL